MVRRKCSTARIAARCGPQSLAEHQRSLRRRLLRPSWRDQQSLGVHLADVSSLPVREGGTLARMWRNTWVFRPTPRTRESSTRIPCYSPFPQSRRQRGDDHSTCGSPLGRDRRVMTIPAARSVAAELWRPDEVLACWFGSVCARPPRGQSRRQSQLSPRRKHAQPLTTKSASRDPRPMAWPRPSLRAVGRLE